VHGCSSVHVRRLCEHIPCASGVHLFTIRSAALSCRRVVRWRRDGNRLNGLLSPFRVVTNSATSHRHSTTSIARRSQLTVSSPSQRLRPPRPSSVVRRLVPGRSSSSPRRHVGSRASRPARITRHGTLRCRRRITSARRSATPAAIHHTLATVAGYGSVHTRRHGGLTSH
jgi:hypothetical protein